MFVMALFLLQVIGLLYTENLKVGFFEIEKKMTFLLVPLFLLPFIRTSKIDYHFLFNRLGLITVLSSVVLLLIALYRSLILNDPNAFYFESFRNYEGFTPIHYVYYSIYFVCGSLWYINDLFEIKASNKYRPFIITAVFLYCLCIVILIASKAGITAFILGSIILVYHKIEKKRTALIVIFCVLVLSIFFVSLNKTTLERFNGLSNDISVLFQDALVDEFNPSGLTLRLFFWKVSLLNLWNDRLFFTGVGTGDSQDYINAVLTLPQYQLYSYQNWNSHNQWVYGIVQLGVINFFALGLLYIASFRMAFKLTDFRLLVFLITTLIFSLSECTLEANKGIVYFGLFFTLLTASRLTPERESGSIYLQKVRD